LIAATALCTGCDRAQEDRAADAAAEAVRDANRALHSGGKAAREAAREAGIAVADGTITARVKTALIADPAVDGTAIDVDTNGGRVTLSGHLPDAAQAERAAQIARAAPGVVAVESRLTIGARSPASGGPPS
jgi:hyperosmotically inducible protein